jgi:hypothetical protein
MAAGRGTSAFGFVWTKAKAPVFRGLFLGKHQLKHQGYPACSALAPALLFDFPPPANARETGE